MSLLRIQKYGIKEISVDPDGVSLSLNKGCQRDNTHYRITSVCQVDETVFFPMEELPEGTPPQYMLAPFSDVSKEVIEADIITRWSSGFRTKGIIELYESYMGLFEIEEKDA